MGIHQLNVWVWYIPPNQTSPLDPVDIPSEFDEFNPAYVAVCLKL